MCSILLSTGGCDCWGVVGLDLHFELSPPLLTMASTGRKRRPTTGRRRHRREIHDDEGGTSSDESSTCSENSSSYAGLSSDEEGGRPVSGEGTESEDEEEATDEEKSGTGDGLASESSRDPLARLLRSDHTLTRMDIDQALLKVWSSALPLEDIMVEVAKQSSLKTLCLDMENVSMGKYDILLECICHSETLQELILCNARVNRHTANAIASALAQNPNSLKELYFKSCTFAGSGFSIMFLGVQHVSALTHLSIEDCSLQGFASEIIAATVPLIKNLECLRLIKTQLPVEGMRYLFDNLALSQSIVELDLSENEFDCQATSWLVGCLQSSDTKIAKLSISSCSLDPSCMEILSRGLTEDKILTSLNLSGNRFGNEGATSLVKLLKENHEIQSLNVKNCGIGKKVLGKLRNGLRYNNSFLKNMFSSEVSLAILDSVGLMDKVTESFG